MNLQGSVGPDGWGNLRVPTPSSSDSLNAGAGLGPVLSPNRPAPGLFGESTRTVQAQTRKAQYCHTNPRVL
jgi:hypothetical protein